VLFVIPPKAPRLVVDEQIDVVWRGVSYTDVRTTKRMFADTARKITASTIDFHQASIIASLPEFADQVLTVLLRIPAASHVAKHFALPGQMQIEVPR
jgi:hypothetical protein